MRKALKRLRPALNAANVMVLIGLVGLAGMLHGYVKGFYGPRTVSAQSLPGTPYDVLVCGSGTDASGNKLFNCTKVQVSLAPTVPSGLSGSVQVKH